MCEVCESEQCEPSEDLNGVPQPPEGFRWGGVGDVIPLGSMWYTNRFVDGAWSVILDGSAVLSEGETLRLAPLTYYCAFPIVASDTSEQCEPSEDLIPIVPSDDSEQEGKTIEPAPVPEEWSDNQKRLARYLEGLTAFDTKESKSIPAIDLVQILFPNGWGVTDEGELYQLGFTGKRTAIRFRAFCDNMKWVTYSSQYDTFCERMFSGSVGKIHTTSGDDIHEIFQTYRPGSCMGGDGADVQSFREVYAVNDDCVGIIYSGPKSNPLIESACSCLYWIGSKRIYLDRLYSSGTYHARLHYDLFADHLEKQYGKPCVPIYCGSHKRNEWSKDITFKLVNHGNPLPYMDTIQNVKNCNSRHIWMTTKTTGLRCTDTSGTWPDGRGRCKCSSCGCAIDEDDAYNWNDATYCSECYSDTVGHCEYTESDCDADDIGSIELYGHNSRWHARSRGPAPIPPGWHTLNVSSDTIDSYFTELHDGRYAENSLTIEDNRGRTFASDPDSWEDAVLTEDGELYHIDDIVQLSDGRYYPQDECVEVDGEWYISGEEPEPENEDTSENEETTEPKELV